MDNRVFWRKEINCNTVIVDDLANSGALISESVIGAFPNHGILERESGEEAIPLVFTEGMNVVLMGISLTEMNGIEATRRIGDIFSKGSLMMVAGWENPEYQCAANAGAGSVYVSGRKTYNELLLSRSFYLSRDETCGCMKCEK